LAETKSHLIYGVKIGYFQETEVKILFDLIADIWEELNKLISSFSPREPQPHPYPEPQP
jgi:hypothetical protein